MKMGLVETLFSNSDFVVPLVVAVICGLIAKSIASNRGMSGGFWWGFFLLVIGIIVVAVRPADAKSKEEYLSNTSHIYYCPNCKKVFSGVSSKYNDKCENCNNLLIETTIPCETWRSYTEYNKEEMKRAFANGQYHRNASATDRSVISTFPSSVSGADEIKKYKDLMDNGVITQEEFEAKKKQLLGL